MGQYLSLSKFKSFPIKKRLEQQLVSSLDKEKPQNNAILCTKIQIFHDIESNSKGRYVFSDSDIAENAIIKKLKSFSFDFDLNNLEGLSISEINKEIQTDYSFFPPPVSLADYFSENKDESLFVQELKQAEKDYLQLMLGKYNSKSSYYQAIPVIENRKWRAVYYLVYDKNQLDLQTIGELDRLEEFITANFYPTV